MFKTYYSPIYTKKRYRTVYMDVEKKDCDCDGPILAYLHTCKGSIRIHNLNASFSLQRYYQSEILILLYPYSALKFIYLFFVKPQSGQVCMWTLLHID